jgi:hypothetical protein
MSELVVPAVPDEEPLARYVYSKRHVREDRTVKPDAFIPHPYPDLSVTRHLGLDEAEIWKIGADIGVERSASLQGRADVITAEFRRNALEVKPEPVPGNPNHVNVVGWPSDKPSQKNLAQRIVLSAKYLAAPA